MPKRAKKSSSTCEEHLFILKPKNNFCRFGQTATISFCDPNHDKSKNKTKKCRNCETLECPIFNNDRNFATPTFIIKSEKVLLIWFSNTMKSEEQKWESNMKEKWWNTPMRKIHS